MAEIALGEVESSDEMNDRVYKFKILLDEDKQKVTVKSSPVTGTYVDGNNIRNILKKIDDDKGYALWGAPYNKTSPDDERDVQYRVYFDDNDKATKLEVFLITLNRKGLPKEPKTLTVDLPDWS